MTDEAGGIQLAPVGGGAWFVGELVVAGAGVAVAVRVTVVPLVKPALQVVPQSIPAGSDLTVPFPVLITVSVGGPERAVWAHPIALNRVAISDTFGWLALSELMDFRISGR